MFKVPAPLYRDPIFDGAADPMIIRSEQNGNFYMLYTQRRANQRVSGVSFCYGTAIGIAESPNGADWHYLGALELDFEFGHNTFWAPEVVYCPEEKRYHMYVSYIRGIYDKWEGVSVIMHYISDDLFHWEKVGRLSFGSERIIDPCIFRLPNGIWRMWYKDERRQSHTCYADSPDLYSWEYIGEATSDCAQEGPNVFEFDGYYWMIADVWNGLGVYRSEDLTSFVRQKNNILKEFGTRRFDSSEGAHADVFVCGGRAFIVYFAYQNADDSPGPSVVQMAELTAENGELVCDRNRELLVDWRSEK